MNLFSRRRLAREDRFRALLREENDRLARAIADRIRGEIAVGLAHTQIQIDPKGIARAVVDGQRQLHQHGRKV